MVIRISLYWCEIHEKKNYHWNPSCSVHSMYKAFLSPLETLAGVLGRISFCVPCGRLHTLPEYSLHSPSQTGHRIKITNRGPQWTSTAHQMAYSANLKNCRQPQLRIWTIIWADRRIWRENIRDRRIYISLFSPLLLQPLCRFHKQSFSDKFLIRGWYFHYMVVVPWNVKSTR